MYVSKISLRNVRGFHDARTVDLDLRRPSGDYAGWTVLAGRNGAGKTSLLRAIALTISGPTAARGLMPDFSGWLSEGQTSAEVLLELVLDPADSSAIAGPVEVGLQWGRPTGEGQPKLSSSGWALGVEPYLDEPVGWLCAAYGPFRRLTGGSIASQQLMNSPAWISRVASLFLEDASLAEGVGWLVQQQLRALENRRGAIDLRDGALAILSDGLLPEGYRVSHVDSEGLWVELDGRVFPLREMSDGYRGVAALAVDVLRQVYLAYRRLPFELVDGVPTVTAAGVVLIDEVEAHLHVSWQQKVGPWFKRHFPRIQFLVTTNSPYVCQAADPGGLIRLPGPTEQTPARVVDPELYQRIVFGSGDDAVLSELFGLETPYSEAALSYRDELAGLELLVLSGEADAAQQRRYAELQDLLTSSPTARARELGALGSKSRARHT